MKPVLAVTRRLPAAVAKRAAESYDVRTQEDDTPLSRAEILALCHGADAALCRLATRLMPNFSKIFPIV